MGYKNGVYISRTLVNGREYGGITNIGYKPTVGEKFRGVETYMFDFDEDLYGCDITVQLLKFLRPEKKFDSIDLLREQMKQDIGVGRSFFHV